MSSAAEKVQQHPAFQQASVKVNYYVSQLDKEVSLDFFCCGSLYPDYALRVLSVGKISSPANSGAAYTGS